MSDRTQVLAAGEGIRPAGAPSAEQPFAPPTPQQAPGSAPTTEAAAKTTTWPHTAWSAPGGAGPDAPPTAPPSRGPGWTGLVAAVLAAALLSGAGTAGTVLALDRRDSRPAAVSTQGRMQVPVPVAGSRTSSPDWPAVAAAVEPSVVAVQLPGGQGSGVILDKQGNILTNAHVVAEAGQSGQLGVVLQDGRGFGAKVVGSDAATDLAVIRIDKAPRDLVPAVLGDSSTVKVGDPVMAVGNPLGLAGTVTTGIVSAVDRPVTTDQPRQQQPQQDFDPFGLFGQTPQQQTSEPVVTDAIQTDAAINPGNSGGALVDAQGRLVGINSSIASLGSGLGGQSGSIGLGFAIPVNQAKNVSQALLKDGKVEHPWLGVGLTAKSVEVDGARRMAAVVSSVEKGAPAAGAGLREGDAVIAVDGSSVSGVESLIARLRERTPGTSVTLTIVRNGKTKEVTVRLAARPSQAG